MFENYKNYTDNGKRQGYHSRTNFSYEKMKTLLDDILSDKLPNFPTRVELKLPKMSKIDLPNLPKIEKIKK